MRTLVAKEWQQVCGLHWGTLFPYFWMFIWPLTMVAGSPSLPTVAALVTYMAGSLVGSDRGFVPRNEVPYEFLFVMPVRRRDIVVAKVRFLALYLGLALTIMITAYVMFGSHGAWRYFEAALDLRIPLVMIAAGLVCAILGASAGLYAGIRGSATGKVDYHSFVHMTPSLLAGGAVSVWAWLWTPDLSTAIEIELSGATLPTPWPFSLDGWQVTTAATVYVVAVSVLSGLYLRAACRAIEDLEVARG